MRRKTMKAFLKEHRTELDAYITKVCSNIGRLNDRERAMWIANDETLYNWARGEGVNV